MAEQQLPQPKLVDVEPLASALQEFAAQRAWAQFHSPKNLAMALTGEVGELVEIFQWMTEEQSHLASANPKLRRRLQEEMADVLFYLVRLAAVAGIDLNEAAQAKLALNESKYPVEISRGTSTKYDELGVGENHR